MTAGTDGLEVVLIVFGALFVVLIAGAVFALRQWEELKQLKRRRDASVSPLLELKQRFDTGEITRDEFVTRINSELKNDSRKAG